MLNAAHGLMPELFRTGFLEKNDFSLIKSDIKHQIYHLDINKKNAT